MKALFLTSMLFLLFSSQSIAATMICETTGLRQQTYRVSKGKIAGFSAYVRGNTIYYLDRGRKGRVTSNGKVYRQGRFYGRIKCNFDKLKRTVAGN